MLLPSCLHPETPEMDHIWSQLPLIISTQVVEDVTEMNMQTGHTVKLARRTTCWDVLAQGFITRSFWRRRRAH